MKKGFTLVEVVLTLSIIGVIAATTIPTMIHETNKKHVIEQLKKSAATLNQAIYNATITNGQLNTWTWQTEDGIANIMHNIITPRLNVGYMCSGNVSGSNSHCSYPIRGIDGNEYNISDIFKSKSTVLLNDGSLVAFTDANTFLSEGDGEGGGSDDDSIDKPTGSECNWGGDNTTLCGVFMVDVNGNKKPNMVGKDIFYYGVYLSGAILPYGSNEGEQFVEDNCSVGSNGKTCAAKITKNGWDVCYSNCDAGVFPYPVRF